MPSILMHASTDYISMTTQRFAEAQKHKHCMEEARRGLISFTQRAALHAHVASEMEGSQAGVAQSIAIVE
jgi:hypothetical protein